SYEADITSSAAGGQHGTATLASATNWFAVCAVFHPRPATPPHSPSTPTGLEATSAASTRVALSWSPSTGNAAGYTVYRDGSVVHPPPGRSGLGRRPPGRVDRPVWRAGRGARRGRRPWSLDALGLGDVGRNGRHRPLLPGELRPRAIRAHDHGAGVRSRISPG